MIFTILPLHRLSNLTQHAERGRTYELITTEYPGYYKCTKKLHIFILQFDNMGREGIVHLSAQENCQEKF